MQSAYLRVLEQIKTSNVVLSLACGAVASIGILVPFLWPLTIIGTSGYVAVLWERCRSYRHTFTISFAFWVVASGAGVWWFWDTIPLTWFGETIPALAAHLLVGTVWTLTTLSLALPGAALGVLIRNARALPTLAPLLVGALWMLIEYARMWGFAFTFASAKTFLAPHFSIAAFGYALAESPYLLQSAQVFGIFGLSALFGLLAGGIALLIVRRRQPFGATVWIGIALLVPFPFFTTLPTEAHPANGMLTFALVSTERDDDAMYDGGYITSLLANTAAVHPDVVVLPEGFSLARAGLTPEERNAIYRSLFKDKETLIISSTLTDGYGELLYESSDRGILATQRKVFLVPIGEYPPPILYPLLSFASRTWEDAPQTPLQHAEPTLSAVPFKNTRIGALLCAEIMSPSLYHAIAQSYGAGILVNVANNGWFNGSRTLHEKIVQLAKVRAVESRVYVLIASNQSPSYAVNPDGELLVSSIWKEESTLRIDIPAKTNSPVLTP